MKSKSDIEFELVDHQRKYERALEDIKFQTQVYGNIHLRSTLENLIILVDRINLLKWMLEEHD